MTLRVADLPACPVCEGPLLPLSLCDTCGVASIRRDVTTIDRVIECQDCHASNPTLVICDSCHARQRLSELPEPERRPGACPNCATFLSPEASSCATCGWALAPASPRQRPAKARKSRRIKGDYDEQLLREIRRIPGVDEARARALLTRGYNALWKIKRSSLEELAGIPEVGPAGAQEIREGLRFVAYFPQRRRKEAILDEEYACPLCGCATSAFTGSCLDCGAVFDEEEMDEDVRRSLLQEGRHSLLAFYDLHLGDDPEDPELWYARGLLMEAMSQDEEALRSLDRAANLDPGARKIILARARFLAKFGADSQTAERMRSTLRSMVDDVALDEEINAFQHSLSDLGPTCSFCDEPLPPGASVCPACSMPVARPTAPVPPAEKKVLETDLLDALVKTLEPTAPETPPAEREPTTPASLEVLVEKFEDSLSPEDLERTRLATLDWLMDELEEAVTPEPPSSSPRGPPAGALPPEATSATALTREHVATAKGFLSKSRLRKRGFVNGTGSTNGRARVNGLVNGRTNGLVNGRGRVNGFINGKGYVNGSGVTIVRLPSPPRRTAYTMIGAGVAMLVLISVFVVFPSPAPLSPIAIDGLFDDWAGIPALDVATRASNPDVEIVRYAALLDRQTLFLHAATRGPTFGDVDGFDGIYFLIDGDGDPSTGFSFQGLGAESVAEAYGNTTLATARLYTFPSDAELNWSRRQGGPGLAVAASNRGLELRVPTSALDSFDPTVSRIAVYADDFAGVSSRSRAALSLTGGAILLEVQPLTTITGAAPVDIMEIRARAVGVAAGESWSVSAFRFNATQGLTYDLTAESVSLTRDQPTAIVRVSVQVPGFFPGDAIELELLGASGPRPVSVVGEPVRAYVLSAPPGKRVDGLFADWAGASVADTDPSRVNNSNVDIQRYGAATDLVTGFFHVEVVGLALGGAMPERILRGPAGSGGAPAPPGVPRRVTGEDVLRVYVDSNASDLGGDDVGGTLADRMLDIRGRDGRVTSKVLYEWSGGWRRMVGAGIDVAKNASAIEGSFPMAPDSNTTRLVFSLSDWSGIEDLTAPVTAIVEIPAPAPQPVNPITVNAPEFELVMAPVAGTMFVVLFLARRRRTSLRG